MYRTGFVHQSFPANASWARSSGQKYWIKSAPPTLNIDRLVRGFMDGIDLFKQEAMKDTDLRANFVSYLTK